MPTFFDSDDLADLYKLLTEEKRPLPAKANLTRFESQLLSDRVSTLVDLGDYLLTTETRRYGAIERILGTLIDELSIPKQWIFRKPARPGDEVSGNQGMTAVDVTGLLIAMEALGMSVDPSRLTNALTPELSDRNYLTSSEFDILYYSRSVGKQRKVLNAGWKGVEGAPKLTEHRDAGGYRFSMTWRGDTAISLEVRGPKYRAPRLQESVTCEFCDMTYVTNNQADSRRHRVVHERKRRVTEPSANKRFAKRLAAVTSGELINSESPLWMHGEAYERARAFRREFGYDFVQWPGSQSTRAPADWEGYLFAAGPDGTIAGACGFMQEESGSRNGQWGLHWIWIAPGFRRSGLLRARWQDLLDRYGDFHIEHPISDAMQAFIRRHGSEKQRSQVLPPL